VFSSKALFFKGKRLASFRDNVKNGQLERLFTTLVEEA